MALRQKDPQARENGLPYKENNVGQGERPRKRDDSLGKHRLEKGGASDGKPCGVWWHTLLFPAK